MKTSLGPSYRIQMRFSHSLRGLAVGAPVLFRGIQFGSVTSVSLDYDAMEHRFPLVVMAQVQPMRLGSIYGRIQKLDKQSGKKLLRILVKDGLRARALKSNLFTGSRYISLDFVPDAKPVEYEPTTQPVRIPTAGGKLSQIKVRIADILKKVDEMTLTEIGSKINTTIQRSNITLKDRNNKLLHNIQAYLKGTHA